MPLIIFDIDGTLVDSHAHILEAQAVAFAAHGMPAPPRDTALSVVGLSLTEAFSVLAGPGGPVDGLAASYKDAWGDLRRRPGYAEVLYPGARDLLVDLAERGDVTLGIATGKIAARRRAASRLARVERSVRDGANGVMIIPQNRIRPLIQACLAETGFAADDAVMIGDTSYDMDMAASAHVAAIGVAWGYHTPVALQAAGALTVVPDMAALRAILFSREWLKL